MTARNVFFGTIIILGCTVLPVVLMLGYDAYYTRDITEKIIARAPERGNFTPREITVVAGEKARIQIRNIDTVTHGFASPLLGVDAGMIKAGHVAIVEFTPPKPGTYDFYCTTWCGEFHIQMRGKIIVVAKTP